MKSLETHYFKLKAISPLHFGAKEEYSFLETAIDEKNNLMKIFDENSFIYLLNSNEKKEFFDFFEQDFVDFSKIIKFMQIKVLQHINFGRTVRASSKYINQFTKQLKSEYFDINKIEVKRTMYDKLTGLPFIPGSSIKGSIRTGVLNHVAENRKFDKCDEMEKILLGSFENDLFSLIKVSDFHAITENNNKIIETKSLKKALNAKTTPKNCNLEINIQNSVFLGTISFEKSQTQRVKKKLTYHEICSAINNFYKKEFYKSIKICEEHGFETEYKINEKNIIIRAGAYSGAESISVNNCLKIERPKKYAGLPTDKALTFRVTDDNKIFGYAELIEISENEFQNLQKQKEDMHKSIFEKKDKEQKKLNIEKQIYYKELEEEKKRKIERLKKMKEDEDKRKAAEGLENEYKNITKDMDEKEKAIFTLKNHDKYWDIGQSISESASKVFKLIKENTEKFNELELKEYALKIKEVWIKKEVWTGYPGITKNKKKDINFIISLLGIDQAEETQKSADTDNTENKESKKSKGKKNKGKRNKEKRKNKNK
jgi:CRISPR-associated protein Csm5